MNVMMCSSAKARNYYVQFERVVRTFGGNPQHYTLGNIYQRPGGDPNPRKMSELAVREADICVFVITDSVGSITWDTELPAAKDMGVPFVVLAHQDAMRVFATYEGVSVQDIPVLEQQQVVRVVRDVIDNYGIEPRVFDNGTFEKELRDTLLGLYSIALAEYRERHLRLRALLDDADTAKRSPDLLRRIALDAFEDTRYRKAATRRLCEVGLSQEDILALLADDLQGVSRLAAELLGSLMKEEATVEFFVRCVQVGNDPEDQGIIRRLIRSMYAMDPVKALQASRHIEFSEIGTRRRVGTMLLEHKDLIIASGHSDDLLEIISICSESTKDEGWLKRCRALRDELREGGCNGS